MDDPEPVIAAPTPAPATPAAVEHVPDSPVEAKAPEPTDAERAIASAYSNSHDGTGFADALDHEGVTLARVTEADLSAMRAETLANPGRQFPPVVAGELVAVDRYGDVHRLNPDRPDAEAIETRFNETRVVEVEAQSVPVSVMQAHAEFAAQYQPTGFQKIRAEFRDRLAHVRTHIETARNGDWRSGAEGLSLLTELVHDMLGADTPADTLRNALAAMAAGRTYDALGLLQAARTALAAGDSNDPGKPEQNDAAIENIDEALAALAAGRRADCMRLTEAALDAWPMLAADRVDGRAKPFAPAV
jgi:hypothetical protein